MSDSGSKRLTEREWIEIEELFALGEKSVADLAGIYGVSPSAITSHMTAKNIKKGEKAAVTRQRVQDAIADQQAAASKLTLERIAETKEQHYTYAKNLSTIIYSMVIKQVKEQKAISAMKDDVRTVKDAIQALQTARQERYAILGLDKDFTPDDIPDELIVTEMTAEDIERVRQEQRQGSASDSDIEDVEKLLKAM